MKRLLQSCLQAFIAWSLVAIGQEAGMPQLAFASAAFGFTLVWHAASYFSSWKWRCLFTSFWFASVQTVQFSWLTSNHYAGLHIYFVYGAMLLLSGAQFTCLSFFVPRENSHWRIHHFFALPSLWVLLEYSRLFIFTGSTWNPVGLALVSNNGAGQLAAIGGVYFLSYLVILTNLLMLWAWHKRHLSLKYFLFPIVCACTPYIFDACYIHLNKPYFSKTLSAAAIDMDFAVEEKMPVNDDWQSTLVPPLEQVSQILQALKPLKNASIDLLLFPEGALPFGLEQLLYRADDIHHLFSALWNKNIELSSLQEPFARQAYLPGEGKVWLLTNRYIMQTLARMLYTDVIIGLDDAAAKYNSAFHFGPDGELKERYAKRILVPMGEYIPFEWARNIAATYGIYDSYQAGIEAKCFSAKVPLGVSICYEETYGHLMRHSRQLGAKMLVNMTNDAWFPNSILPQQHLAHARLRTIENGFALIRACNKGVTIAIDAFGRNIPQKVLPFAHNENAKVRLFLFDVPIHAHPTLYTYWGDYFVLFLS